MFQKLVKVFETALSVMYFDQFRYFRHLLDVLVENNVTVIFNKLA